MNLCLQEVALSISPTAASSSFLSSCSFSCVHPITNILGSANSVIADIFLIDIPSSACFIDNLMQLNFPEGIYPFINKNVYNCGFSSISSRYTGIIESIRLLSNFIICWYSSNEKTKFWYFYTICHKNPVFYSKIQNFLGCSFTLLQPSRTTPQVHSYPPQFLAFYLQMYAADHSLHFFSIRLFLKQLGL